MFAIIETGGKQYRVSPGMELAVEKLAGAVGEQVRFAQVLALGEGEAMETGTPCLEGAVVEGEILSHEAGEKVMIIKKKRRQHYRRRKGFRPQLSRIRIDLIKRGG